METNQNSNKGVFPGVQAPNNGEIKVGIPTPTTPKNTMGVQNGVPSNLEHHNESVLTNEIINTDDAKTFIRLETKNGEKQVEGVIEIDLISFRERGQESRFLSVSTIGADTEGKESTTTMNINNETDFNLFKKFISELNWND